MSVRTQALRYTAAALAVAAVVIISSALYLGPQANTGAGGGTPSKLVIQLTDPPMVPRGTSSLNLTYSAIGLLVGEPANGGQEAVRAVNIDSSGTLDLLRLQNVSQTIAMTSLPNGTVVYSFTLTVSSVSIDVNGTKSAVALATGGDALAVTLATPSAIEGTDIALLQLNPVVVSSQGGYQVIPSALGIIRAEGKGEQNLELVGAEQSLTSSDANRLERAQGSLTAALTALSVSGNSTTLTIQVKNSGNSSVVLDAIGVQGNFTAAGFGCNPRGSESSAHAQGEGGDHSATSSTFTQTNCKTEPPEEILIAPVNATVTGASCVPLTMELGSGGSGWWGGHGLALAKGGCVTLTFSGAISFGRPNAVLVPSTDTGQVYGIRVVASEGANLAMSCRLPASPSSCSAARDQQHP